MTLPESITQKLLQALGEKEVVISPNDYVDGTWSLFDDDLAIEITENSLKVTGQFGEYYRWFAEHELLNFNADFIQANLAEVLLSAFNIKS